MDHCEKFLELKLHKKQGSTRENKFEAGCNETFPRGGAEDGAAGPARLTAVGGERREVLPRRRRARDDVAAGARDVVDADLDVVEDALVLILIARRQTLDRDRDLRDERGISCIS